MASFHTIAVPHKDILEGRLTMDVWAANLWEVFHGQGPDEYRDKDRFFEKTFHTQGLKTIIQTVGHRLRGEGGDAIIQLKTPFGGGKTHALIALYHTFADVKRVVMVGTEMSATDDTPWGMLEAQLTGAVHRFSKPVAPGADALRNLLRQHQPCLILIDELLEYVTKAAGVAVEKSALSSQVMAFMQELTEAAATLDKVVVMATLPASVLEHYDEAAEKLFQQLEHVTGRVEKIYAPVEEHEIASIIRQRLFSDVDLDKAKKIIRSFVKKAEEETFLPYGTEPVEYRDRFEKSYPFLPDVIEVLYHRWGSFPNFQRTRGVLRLLSLVVHGLIKSNLEYISLADFRLANQDLRQDLLRHIGPEFDSVLASDITDVNAGARKVDMQLGDAYRGLGIGSRVATTIFMYSFSGGPEKGAEPSEIKRSATTMSNAASLISDALDKLRDSLFYLQSLDGRYFFSNRPNLNRVFHVRRDNVQEAEVAALESELLNKALLGKKLRTQYLATKRGEDVSDGPELKLVVLSTADDRFVGDMMERKGATPRVYRNTLFFLTPYETEKAGLYNVLRDVLAWRSIQKDPHLQLTEQDRTVVKEKLRNAEKTMPDMIRRCYRKILVPVKDGFKELDLGIGTYGDAKPLDDEVYEKLRAENEIMEKVAPLVIKTKYLGGGEGYVFTEQLYQSSLKTPGEMRTVGRDVWEAAIKEGVAQGLFGLGEFEGDKLLCHYFKKSPTVSFSGSEILIKAEYCEEEERPRPAPGKGDDDDTTRPAPSSPPQPPPPPSGGKESVRLRFALPKGKASSLLGVINFLQTKFGEVQVDLRASDGRMTEDEYEDKVLEAFRQMGVKVEN